MLAAIKNALDPYSDRCRRRSDYTQWHASPQVLKQDIVREPVLWQDIVQKPNRAMYAQSTVNSISRVTAIPKLPKSKPEVHASFCELREWHRNVNSTFCGLSSKLGGIVLSWEDFQAIGVKAMDGKVQVLKEKLERLLREAAETAAELQATERGAGKPVHFSEIEAAAH